MNRDWEIVNVFLTHSAPDDMYQAWLRIRAEQGESTNSTHNSQRDAIAALEKRVEVLENLCRGARLGLHTVLGGNSAR